MSWRKNITTKSISAYRAIRFLLGVDDAKWLSWRLELPVDRVFNSLLRLHYCSFVRGIHRWPVDSHTNGTVTRKMLPLDDVFMCNVHFISTIYQSTSRQIPISWIKSNISVIISWYSSDRLRFRGRQPSKHSIWAAALLQKKRKTLHHKITQFV